MSEKYLTTPSSNGLFFFLTVGLVAGTFRFVDLSVDVSKKYFKKSITNTSCILIKESCITQSTPLAQARGNSEDRNKEEIYLSSREQFTVDQLILPHYIHDSKYITPLRKYPKSL